MERFSLPNVVRLENFRFAGSKSLFWQSWFRRMATGSKHKVLIFK